MVETITVNVIVGTTIIIANNRGACIGRDVGGQASCTVDGGVGCAVEGGGGGSIVCDEFTVGVHTRAGVVVGSWEVRVERIGIIQLVVRIRETSQHLVCNINNVNDYCK